MKLISPFKCNEAFTIIKEEIDSLPSFCRSLLTLNAHRYRGSSRVCGVLKEKGFELRNRKDPYFSIKAIVQLQAIEKGTEIQIKFEEPFLYRTFRMLRRYDLQTILDFIKLNLKAEVIAEP